MTTGCPILTGDHARSQSSSYIENSSLRSHIVHNNKVNIDGRRDVLLAPPAALTSCPRSRPGLSHHVSHHHTATLPNLSLPPLVKRRSAQEGIGPLQTSNSAGGPSSENIAFQLSPEHSPQISPSREKWSFLNGKTDDLNGAVNRLSKSPKLSDWFNGESEPVNISVLPSPTKEKTNPLDILSSPSNSSRSSLLKRTSTLTPSTRPPVTRPAATMASRFAFFKPKPQPSDDSSQSSEGDEFTGLDIKKALLPIGQPDTISPTSFQILFHNADNLLTRMQTAYRQRTQSLKEVTAEKEAQKEELDETETRARHLKQQLDDLSSKLTEQDAAMMDLVDQLAREKQARREDEETRKKSIRIVTSNDPSGTGRRARASTGSDSGFESDGDSADNGSVFSRPGDSPNRDPPLSSATSINSTDIEFAQTHGQIPQPKALQMQGSRLQQQSAEAWDIVGMLKTENCCLKARVDDLEGVLSGCLDVIRS